MTEPVRLRLWNAALVTLAVAAALTAVLMLLVPSSRSGGSFEWLVWFPILTGFWIGHRSQFGLRRGVIKLKEDVRQFPGTAATASMSSFGWIVHTTLLLLGTAALIVIPLGVLFLLVRFVKWAWLND